MCCSHISYLQHFDDAHMTKAGETRPQNDKMIGFESLQCDSKLTESFMIYNLDLVSAGLSQANV